ncbi:putative mediator of RNA polymerase II transcription subunit 12 [Pieris rapae]|uniref:putative mediator of RNA polymerase II transcription subunit 12 n=1 Tax=Pieris rapae TaxID=64459 RepID=UPI001E27FDDB|nr:putative mediator of RNA polymerase II transcription subunit 12 [Pieris rapae]
MYLATALPLNNTALNNITEGSSTEKLSIGSINLPPSHDNLNQGNASSIEKSDKTENNSNDYHEGRGDTPLLDLGAYEEQHNKEKEIALNTTYETTIENEKMENNVSNEFAEPKSTSNNPITETTTLLVESTTLPFSTEKEVETTLVSTSNSLQEIKQLENQKTTPLPLFDIQHKQLKQNIFSPAPNAGPKNELVSEKQEITSSPVLKSNSQQKEQELKSKSSKVSEAPKTPSSIHVHVSQPKEQLQEKQEITSSPVLKSNSQQKEQELKSKSSKVSEAPKTPSSIHVHVSQTKEQLQEKQEITSSPVLKLDSQQKKQEFKSEASKVSEAPKTPSSIPVYVSQPTEHLQEEQEITSSPVFKSDSQQKEQEFKSEASKVSDAPKMPSSNPVYVSQPKEQLQEKQEVTSISFPKSQTQLKEETSVSEPKTALNLPDTETQQSGQSLKKQITPSSNSFASGNSERRGETKGEHKKQSSSPVIKSEQKGQELKRKDKTSPLLSASKVKYQKGFVIPSSDSHVLQKEREPTAERSNPAIKLKEHKMKQKPEAVGTVLESLQKHKLPEREKITSLPISDIQKEDELGEMYNCEDGRIWFNVAVPPLLYGNGMQAHVPLDLSPLPIFLPYPNPFFFKRPLIRYPNFMIV